MPLCVDFWSALSAAGTILSAVVALAIALSTQRKQLDIAFVWNGVTKYNPTLVVANTGARAVIPAGIIVKYRGVKIGNYNLLEETTAENNETIMPGGLFRLSTDSTKWLSPPKSNNPDRKYRMKITLIDIKGARFRTAMKFSKTDMDLLFFGQGFSN